VGPCRRGGDATCSLLASTESSPPRNLLSANPAPIDAAVIPDTARAAGEMIRAANGGRVKATGGDGTAYTLEIPPYALVFDTTITLTPVERFDGVALVTQPSNTFGVSMEPDGLELFVPATLRVRPVEPVPTQASPPWTSSVTAARSRQSATSLMGTS
jgi:hypothetical protein